MKTAYLETEPLKTEALRRAEWLRQRFPRPAGAKPYTHIDRVVTTLIGG